MARSKPPVVLDGEKASPGAKSGNGFHERVRGGRRLAWELDFAGVRLCKIFSSIYQKSVIFVEASGEGPLDATVSVTKRFHSFIRSVMHGSCDVFLLSFDATDK